MDIQLQPNTDISPDRFKCTILPVQQDADADHSPTVIYMISGNPGLISYYHTFLSTLADRLSSLSTKQGTRNQFHIYGHSLNGFELEEASPSNGNGNGSTTQPCSLEEQICFVQRKLDSFIGALDAGPRRAKVILVGHSVGSYIAMEVLRRHRERSSAMDSTSSSSSGAVGFDIIGGVMLFPTVVDIALSPSGRKLTTILSFVPQLALLAGIFVRILVACVPDLMLRSLVRFYMQSASDEMVTATTSFIKSRRGVRQALHMAADEMETITADRWSDDVWGVPGAGEPLTRLFFYFGRNDHWVAERTRDDIIHMRGRHAAGPKMVVCEEGLPHAFVLKRGDTDVVASKVAGMVMEILQAD